MATQLKQSDLRPIPVPASEAYRGFYPDRRPNIRVAFSAGVATLAIRDKLADMPEAESTLDEIALGEQAEQVIAEAKRVLSPDLYRAFLAWAEASATFSTKWENDEEGAARCDRHNAALDAFSLVPVANAHDLAIKSYVLMLAVSDSPSAGPMWDGNEVDVGYFDAELLHTVRRDYALVSALPGMFDDLAKRAWALSDRKGAWTVPVGGVITAAFSRALGEIDSDSSTPAMPVIGHDSYPLPILGIDVSPRLREIAERYKVAMHSDAEGAADVWNSIAIEIAAYPPECPADIAAKLMLGLHYLHPTMLGDRLAIETESFEANAAGEILIACVDDLLRPTVAAPKPSFGAWSKVQRAFERADAAMEACSPNNWRQFQKLANKAYDLRIELFKTPAPTAAELAYKLALYNRTDAQHLVIAAEIGAALEADAKRLAAVPVATDDQWATATAAFETVAASLKQPGLGDERYDKLADEEWDAGRAVIALPSRTIADVLTKLRIQMQLAVMIEHDDLAEVLADLERLHGETVEIGPESPALLDAFTDRRQQFVANYDVDLSGEVAEAYFQRLRENDETLLNGRAATIEGVLAKLRVGFANSDPCAWSDHAMADINSVAFREGLKTSDMYERLLWSAIEDLARIGGVNLAEQGL